MNCCKLDNIICFPSFWLGARRCTWLEKEQSELLSPIHRIRLYDKTPPKGGVLILTYIKSPLGVRGLFFVRIVLRLGW